MNISSSKEAGSLVKRLREERHLSRKELSQRSGIPLRTIYAIENGELNNLSFDRLSALLSSMGARFCVQVDGAQQSTDTETNRLVEQASRGTAGTSDIWGICS